MRTMRGSISLQDIEMFTLFKAVRPDIIDPSTDTAFMTGFMDGPWAHRTADLLCQQQ